MPVSRRFQSMSRSGMLIEELAGHHLVGLPPLRAHGGTGDVQTTLGTRDAHICQTTLLGKLVGVLHRPRVRERALLHAGEEHNGVFRRPLAVCRVISVTLPESSPSEGSWSESRHQRRGLQESRERGVRRVLLEFGGDGLQLGQVLHAGGILWILGPLQFFEQTGLREHLPHHFGRLAVDVRPRTRSGSASGP